MFKATLSITVRRWKQPKHITNGQISKIWYICLMEFLSEKKRQEAQTHAQSLINLESLLLKERNQTQVVIYDDSTSIKCL